MVIHVLAQATVSATNLQDADPRSAAWGEEPQDVNWRCDPFLVRFYFVGGVPVASCLGRLRTGRRGGSGRCHGEAATRRVGLAAVVLVLCWRGCGGSGGGGGVVAGGGGG